MLLFYSNLAADCGVHAARSICPTDVQHAMKAKFEHFKAQHIGHHRAAAFVKESQARYGPRRRPVVTHEIIFLCWRSASMTNSKSRPCSIALRLYSARRFRGALFYLSEPLLARHFQESLPENVAKVLIMHELCTYSSIRLL
jgi:hypothetical protein